MIAKILNLISAQGLAADGVERRLGMPQGRISKWNRGKGEPTARQLFEIARFLGVTAESLVDDNLEPMADQYASRRRVLDIIEEIGWDAAWTRLIREPTIMGPTKKVSPGDYVDLPIQRPSDSPKAPRKSGSG